MLVLAVCVAVSPPLRGDCVDDRLPDVVCTPVPALSPVATPPTVSLPPGAPGASPVCGICAGPGGGGHCFQGADCASGACDYAPICTPDGVCHLPEPESLPYVDVRCIPVRPPEPDDTCRLKRAAEYASGRVLWIAPELLLEVSPDGEEIGGCRVPTDVIPGTSPPVHQHGVPIHSYTTVTGGGTIRLRVAEPTPPGAACDDSDPHPSVESCQVGHMLKVKDAVGVTISGLRFDGNAPGLACPNEGFYPGRCEHRHAISVRGAASDVTIADCTMVDLVGDGVYIADIAEGTTRRVPTRILVRGNRLFANPEYRNRNGVSVIAARDVTVENNLFVGMGRGYFDSEGNPKSMPGAIDLEPNVPAQVIERVRIAGNDIRGWSGCLNQNGVGVSNHVLASVSDIRIDGNRIQGCHQSGISVGGGGVSTRPVVLTGNVVSIERPDPRIANLWGIIVVGNVVGGVQVPSYAHVSGNSIDGVAGGASMTGLFVSASRTVAASNRIRRSGRLGVFLDERYADLTRFTDRNVFCGNLLCDNGTEPWDSAMTIWGSFHQVVGNHIGSSPRGISISWGERNTFSENSMLDVNSCGSAPFGCIFCGAPVTGCQFVETTNQGDGTMTSCAPCRSDSDAGHAGRRRLQRRERAAGSP